MQWVAAFGGIAFVLASLVVGSRLLWVAWRTRGITEFVLGAGLLLMGGVSYPVTTLAHEGAGLSPGTRAGLVAAHMVFNTLGMTGIAWFTRRVFRPDAAWSAVAVLAVFGLYLGAALAQGLGPGLLAFAVERSGPWNWSQLAAALTPVWAGAEALRYHAQMRRRLRIGLAEPEVVQRFKLWGVAMLLASGITVTSRVLEMAGVPVMGTAAGAAVVGPPGVVIAGCLWLAFFPPRAYLRRIQGRAAAA